MMPIYIKVLIAINVAMLVAGNALLNWTDGPWSLVGAILCILSLPISLVILIRGLLGLKATT